MNWIVSMFRRLLWILLTVLFFVSGAASTRYGFDRIETLRKVERVPRTTIGALIPGEANVSGVARMHEGIHLLGPDSGDVCLYYKPSRTWFWWP